MDIVIPTLGRATQAQQYTLNAMVTDGLSPALVVNHAEVDQYSWFQGAVLVVPAHISGISGVRDWLVHEAPLPSDHIAMFDDDLHFFARRGDDRTKFRTMEPGELANMVRRMDRHLEKYPHAGIASREGGNRNTDVKVFNTRTLRVLAYRKSYLRDYGITFAPLPVMEDFHVSLQILRTGADIVVDNEVCSNQAHGSGAAGGCSTYRTLELQAQGARLLEERHRGFVRVSEKTTKTAWGGGTRTDVTVYWKKARESANHV